MFAIILLSVSVAPIHADEIGIGDVLFSADLSGQYIETENLLISMQGTEYGLYDDPYYRIAVRSKINGAQSFKDFPENGGGSYNLVGFNYGRYCDEQIIFITLRQGWPRLADGLQFRFETHAFHRDSLKYLASAGGHFEDITPFECGFDFEFPVEMPQKFGVDCSGSVASRDFEFSITVGAE